jgi:hypothetical protein
MNLHKYQVAALAHLQNTLVREQHTILRTVFSSICYAVAISEVKLLVATPGHVAPMESARHFLTTIMRQFTLAGHHAAYDSLGTPA